MFHWILKKKQTKKKIKKHPDYPLENKIIPLKIKMMESTWRN